MTKFYKFFFNIILFFFKKLGIKKNFISNLKVNLGDNNLILNRKKYSFVKDIRECEIKIFSQNGEDGIIDYLINQLKITDPNFVEIGVGDYEEANTRFLYEKYHRNGLIIDCEENLKKKVLSNINSWKGNIKIVEEFLSSKNIQEILKQNIDFEVDIFSLDVDGIDYWLLEKINIKFPKIFIVEYNAVFGNQFDISVPDISNFSRSKYHYSTLCYGMSLKALIRIMKLKKYYFVGTNSLRNNAFFVSNEYPKDKYFPNLIVDSDKIDNHTNSVIRESRNEKGDLNYLPVGQRLNEIKDCEIIDFSDGAALKKISDLKYF